MARVAFRKDFSSIYGIGEAKGKLVALESYCWDLDLKDRRHISTVGESILLN